MACTIFQGDALDAYARWPAPVVILSDGAYGIEGFPGDPATPEELPSWYAAHVEAWARASTPATTLWFWCTEIGWATMHPHLEQAGFLYVGLNVWDKGIAHAAGSSNTKTLRQFPVVTEVCAHYVRDLDAAVWNDMTGATNVWPVGALRGRERRKDVRGGTLHGNQKPLGLLERLVLASSRPNDVVWEPFGGLCPAVVAAAATRRHGYGAERDPAMCAAARQRLAEETAQQRLLPEG